MAVVVDATEVGERFGELVALVGRGVEVMVRDGDAVLQLVPPVPPMSAPPEHKYEVYPNGMKVRDDFDEPMELVDSALVREWETLAEWVHALRKSDVTTADNNSQHAGGN